MQWNTAGFELKIKQSKLEIEKQQFGNMFLNPPSYHYLAMASVFLSPILRKSSRVSIHLLIFDDHRALSDDILQLSGGEGCHKSMFSGVAGSEALAVVEGFAGTDLSGCRRHIMLNNLRTTTRLMSPIY